MATNAAGSVYSDVVNVKRAITISFPKGEPRVVTALLGEPLSLECSNPGGYPQPTLHWVIQVRALMILMLRGPIKFWIFSASSV